MLLGLGLSGEGKIGFIHWDRAGGGLFGREGELPEETRADRFLGVSRGSSPHLTPTRRSNVVSAHSCLGTSRRGRMDSF